MCGNIQKIVMSDSKGDAGAFLPVLGKLEHETRLSLSAIQINALVSRSILIYLYPKLFKRSSGKGASKSSVIVIFPE